MSLNSTVRSLPGHEGRPRPVSRLARVLPSRAADAAHDAAHETAARFGHGAYSESCPTCHVPAGSLCLARRSVHAARRDQYRRNPQRIGVMSLVGAPA